MYGKLSNIFVDEYIKVYVDEYIKAYLKLIQRLYLPKGFRQILWKDVKLLKMGNFTFLYDRRRQDVFWDHTSECDGWVASSSLSGSYLQNYTSYGYEILLVDRSHQVWSALHMNLNSYLLNFGVIAFVYFHT